MVRARWSAVRVGGEGLRVDGAAARLKAEVPLTADDFSFAETIVSERRQT